MLKMTVPEAFLIVVDDILSLYLLAFPYCCTEKAIILLLYQTLKVLKDSLAHLGPYQTLTKVWYNDPGGGNIVRLPTTKQI
jgi:hypothetical protein